MCRRSPAVLVRCCREGLSPWWGCPAWTPSSSSRASHSSTTQAVARLCLRFVAGQADFPRLVSSSRRAGWIWAPGSCRIPGRRERGLRRHRVGRGHPECHRATADPTTSAAALWPNPWKVVLAVFLRRPPGCRRVLERSETMKSSAAAMSSGRATRPRGVCGRTAGRSPRNSDIRGVHTRGRHGVDPDPCRSQLDGGRAHQRHEGGLHRPYAAWLGAPRVRRRTHVGDRPAAGSRQHGAPDLGYQVGVTEHDVELPVPVGIADVDQGRGRDMPTMSMMTSTFQLLLGVGEEPRYLVAPGDVTRPPQPPISWTMSWGARHRCRRSTPWPGPA